MTNSEMGSTPGFADGRLSVLIALTQHLGFLQLKEQEVVDRFEVSPDHVPRLAISECMTRMALIGELVEWANLQLGRDQLERKLQTPSRVDRQ